MATALAIAFPVSDVGALVGICVGFGVAAISLVGVGLAYRALIARLGVSRQVYTVRPANPENHAQPAG